MSTIGSMASSVPYWLTQASRQMEQNQAQGVGGIQQGLQNFGSGAMNALPLAMLAGQFGGMAKGKKFNPMMLALMGMLGGQGGFGKMSGTPNSPGSPSGSPVMK